MEVFVKTLSRTPEHQVETSTFSCCCQVSCNHGPQETAFPEGRSGRDLGCLDCMETAAEGYPHMEWREIVLEVNSNPAKKEKFLAARDVHTGETAFSAKGAQSSVKSMKEQGVLTYRDLGLLTDSEFKDVLRVAPNTAKIKPVSWVNEEGQTLSGFLVSLMGCPCSIVHAIRKVRLYSRIQVSFANLLVQPGKQLSDSQGQNFYHAACEQELNKRPRYMKLSNLWRLKQCGDIIDLAEELEAPEEGGETGDGEENPDSEAIVAVQDGEKKGVAAPKSCFGFLDESPQHPASKAKKKVAKRDRSASPGPSSKAGRSSVGQGGPLSEDNEHVKFLLEEDPGMVKVYKLYQKIKGAKGTEPTCLLSLNAQTYLNGGGADGRSVDGAGTSDSLSMPSRSSPASSCCVRGDCRLGSGLLAATLGWSPEILSPVQRRFTSCFATRD